MTLDEYSLLYDHNSEGSSDDTVCFISFVTFDEDVIQKVIEIIEF